MKKTISMISYSLILSLGLLACAPQNTPVSPGTNQQQVLSDAEINSQVRAVSLNVFAENAAGVRNPLSPDQLEYLQLGQNTRIAAQDLILPGTAGTEDLSDSSAQRALLSKVAQGENQVFFNGAGQYTVFMPASTTGLINLKLRDQNSTHRLLNGAELRNANLILQPNGSLKAEMNAGGDFGLLQNANSTPRDWLQELLQSKSPAERLQLLDMANRYLLYVQANMATLRFPDLRIENFVLGADGSTQPGGEANSEGLETADASFKVLNEQLADPNHQVLLNFAGRWEPESAFLKALIPGSKLVVGLSFDGANSFQASAELAEASFSTQGTVPDLSGQSPDQLNLTVSRGNQSVQVELKVLNENRLSLTLLRSQGADELNPLLNNPIYLNRMR